MNKFHLIRKIYPFCIGLALILGAEYFYMNILIGFAEPDLNGFTLEAAALMTTLYFSLSNHKSFSLLALPLIFIVSPLTIFLISHQPLHYLSFMPFMGLAAGLWGLWAALVFLCRKFSLGKYVSLLLTLAVLLFPLALWSCYFMTGSWPIFTVLLAIMQTNGKEAEEFLTSHLSLSAFFLMLAVFGYLFYFYRNFSLISIKTDCLWKRGLLCLAALLSFYLLFVSRDNMLTQMAAEAKEYQANYDLFLWEKDRR
jgi:glucan phosphoethanolaminetransferase (alkaline phosphatase superfamily)